MSPIVEGYTHVYSVNAIACLTSLSRRLVVEEEKNNEPEEEHKILKSNARWGNVKTWMFGHVLSSSFTRVSLSRQSSQESIHSKKSSSSSLSDTIEKTMSCSSSSDQNDWNVSYKSIHSSQQQPETSYSFEMCRLLGSGSYGTVLLCHEQTDPSQLYAMKVIPKCKLSQDPTHRETQRLLTEKNVLSRIQHPFITTLYCTFETKENLYYIMEYCAGGDLYYLLEKFHQNRLPESMVQFYAASIALALHCLHQQEIMYRDLKPENLLLDAYGFLRLADFGFAKEFVPPFEQKCTTFCGSIDYMAPEIIMGEGYRLAADIWSFGCVLYELLTGFPPFYTPQDRNLLFRKITRTEPVFPSYFSSEMVDLLSKMLDKNPSQRIGCGEMGMREIFEHPFFSSIDWYQLSIKQVVPPFIPTLNNPMDTTHFEPQFTSQPIHGTVVYDQHKESDSTCLFEDFDWCAETAAFVQ